MTARLAPAGVEERDAGHAPCVVEAGHLLAGLALLVLVAGLLTVLWTVRRGNPS